MYFYEILQSIIKERGLSIADVAHMCELSDSTVRSAIARKNKTIALDVAFKLSKGLDVSLEMLNGEIVEEPRQLSPIQKQLISYIEQIDDRQLIIIKNFIRSLEEYKESFSTELSDDKDLEISYAAYDGKGIEHKKITKEQLEEYKKIREEMTQ